MKKIFLMSIACLLIGLIACNNQSRDYKLTGTVEGLEDGTVLELVPMSHDQDSAFAEATVNGGKFTFEGTVNEDLPFPMCVNIRVKDSYGAESLMLEPGEVTVEGTATKGKPADDGTDIYDWKVTVKGGAENDKLNSYKAKRGELDKLYNDYHEQHEDVLNQYNEARNAKDEAKMKQIEQSDAYKAFSKAEGDFFKTVEDTYKGIITDNKDTYWGPMMAIYLMSYFTQEQKEMFDSFSPEAQQSWYGKRMLDEIFPGGQPGDKATEFTVKDDDGKEFTLAELAQGKKVILIDFWASWCGPCRKEIPNVKKQYELYKDKGFEVVSISTDQNEAAWRKALEQEQLQWPNFRDTMGAANAYKVKSIPAMFLFDAENLTLIAAGENARGEALAAKLAEIFK